MMDIEKIAKKHHFLKHEVAKGMTWFEVQHIEHLQAFSNEIIELCAKECNKIAWVNKNTPMLGAELNALKCEEAVRNLKG